MENESQEKKNKNNKQNEYDTTLFSIQIYYHRSHPKKTASQFHINNKKLQSSNLFYKYTYVSSILNFDLVEFVNWEWKSSSFLSS